MPRFFVIYCGLTDKLRKCIKNKRGSWYFNIQNSERVQLLQCPQVYTYYMAESAEWIVRALTHHPHVSSLKYLLNIMENQIYSLTTEHCLQPYSILYLNYSTNGKWNRSKEFFSNLSFTVKISLKRHPHYYVQMCILISRQFKMLYTISECGPTFPVHVLVNCTVQ